MNKKLLPYILSLSLIIPSVLAENPTVRSGLTGFANGFRGLFQGNTGSFVDGLIAAAPVIGLFVVVFGLMFFLTKLTLFKDDAHSKYARMIAIGIGLIGVAQQSVFNAILGWSTLFLTLSFIILVIFMFIIFLNHSRKNHYDTNKSMFNAQSEFLSAKSDAKKAKQNLDKITHEIGLDNKLYAKTDQELESLDRDLTKLNRLSGDELKQVDKLADLLRKASAAANRGENSQVHAYVQALTREIAALVTSMQHEGQDDKDIHALLEKIRHNLSYSFKDEKKELTEDEHLNKILSAILKDSNGLTEDFDDKKISGLAKRIMRSGSDLHKHLLNIRNAVTSIKALNDRVEKYSADMASYSYQPKHDAASAFRTALMTQDFAEAHNQLDFLRSLIERGHQEVGKIHHLDIDMEQLISVITENETSLRTIIGRIGETIKEELKKEQFDISTKKNDILHARKSLENHISLLKAHSSSLLHSLSEIHLWIKDDSNMHYSHSAQLHKIKSSLGVTLSNFLSGQVSLLNKYYDEINSDADFKLVLSNVQVFLKSFNNHLSSTLFKVNWPVVHTVIGGLDHDVQSNLKTIQELSTRLKTDISTAETFVDSELNKYS